MKKLIQQSRYDEMLAGRHFASFEASSGQSGIRAYIEEHFEAFQVLFRMF